LKKKKKKKKQKEKTFRDDFPRREKEGASEKKKMKTRVKVVRACVLLLFVYRAVCFSRDFILPFLSNFGGTFLTRRVRKHMTNDDAPSSSLRKEDEANERRRAYARNKTIDLKRDDAYALVRIELEKKTKTNGDEDDNELLPKGGGRRTITSKTTTTDAPAALPVPKMTRGTFLEIIENALLVMRGSIGGNIEKHVLHFENEDEKRKSKTAGVGAVRVKRKDLETFTSALRGYDRLYKTTENSEDVGLRIEIVCVANSPLDVVGIERERDAVGRLLRGGD